MTNKNTQMVYQEKFIFRTRIHQITEKGIKTQQNSFFVKSEVITPFEELGGYLIQYKSELNISNLIISIFFLWLGFYGIYKKNDDGVGFVICVCFISSAIYWLIWMFSTLNYIGSFYFSHTTYKNEKGFEIKSKYPVSDELVTFLKVIQDKQKNIAIDNLLNQIPYDHDEGKSHYENQVKYFRNVFSIEDTEYQQIINSVTTAFNTKKSDI